MIAIITQDIPGRQARPSLSGDEAEQATAGQPAPRSPYFKMDKTLCDALLKSLSGVELKIGLAVERHTTGHYSRSCAEISLSLLVEWTGSSKTAVLQARRRLIEEGVLEEVIPHSNRRGAYLRVSRDPSLWGAFSVPPREGLRLAGGPESAPQGSTDWTSEGKEATPLEVVKSDPLNGSKIYRESSERGQPGGDDQGSPPTGLAAFHEGLQGAPEWIRAGLRGLPRQDTDSTPPKEQP